MCVVFVASDTGTLHTRSVANSAQFVNFRFVPIHLQAFVVNCGCIGWNAFLSYVQHHGFTVSEVHPEGDLDDVAGCIASDDCSSDEVD